MCLCMSFEYYYKTKQQIHIDREKKMEQKKKNNNTKKAGAIRLQRFKSIMQTRKPYEKNWNICHKNKHKIYSI